MYRFILAMLIVVLFFGSSFSQEQSDKEAIKSAALDYIEGWYNGDAVRMENALHPELAKRNVTYSKDGKWSRLDQMSALTLIQYTRHRKGKEIPEDEQQKEVTVFDVFGNTATAKIVANDWIDYLHLAKWHGQWKIVNVLWERKAKIDNK